MTTAGGPACRGAPGPRGQHGSATLPLLACVGVLLVLSTAFAVAVGMVAAHRRAQSAADLAALAAAVARDCTAASEVAAANSARLLSCRAQAADWVVQVAVTGPDWQGSEREFVARARAGPADPGQTPGAPASSTSSSRSAPALSSGLFWLPHLGDCTHAGHPCRHGQLAMVSRVARNQAAAVR